MVNPGPAEPRICSASANSADPDEFASLDLYCHSICEFISTTWIKQSNWLMIRSGLGILIYSSWQGFTIDDANGSHP